MTDSDTHTSVVARSHAIAKVLNEHAAEAEQLRRLPPATVAAAEPLWPMVVPTGVGGHGLGITSLCESTRIMARSCPASAWTISFLVLHGWLLARWPDAARRELFNPERPYALAPAPLAPTGTITPVASDHGGPVERYRLSGRWEWATGVHHGDWVMVHAIEEGPDLVTRFALVPIADIDVDDVWFTMGMRATGSNTVILDDVEVPAHRTVVARSVFDGDAADGNATDAPGGDGMAGLPVVSVLATVASTPALGAAEAAVDLLQERIAGRVLAYTLGEAAKEQPAAQIRLAAARADLTAVQARWERTVADLDDAARRGRPLTDVERGRVRLTAAATVRDARAVITAAADGIGASPYLDGSGSPLPRLQRDVEVLKGHAVFDWDRAAELAGRLELGLDRRPTDMV